MRVQLSITAALLAALALASPALAKGGGAYGSYSSGTHGHRSTHGVARDAHSHIARSEKAKDAFERAHPCPSTGKSYGACPGYVIDHVTPLKRGGADEPYNMQWQTEAAAKAKDKWE
jgi:hypothetical protein